MLNYEKYAIIDFMISFDPIQPYAVNTVSFNMKLFGKVTEFLAFFNAKSMLPKDEIVHATTMDRILKDSTYNATY